MLEKSHKFVTCQTCTGRRNSLLNHFCTDELDHLNSHRACNYYKKHQAVFLEGSFPRGVYCINQGLVKIFKRGDEGKEQIIHIAKAGEMVGFRAMFTEEPYKVAAEALEESNICFIGKEDFLNLMDTNPVLRNGIIKELSKGERIWSFSTYNVYNQMNPFFLFFKANDSGVQTLHQLTLFPLIPSVNYQFRFK